MDEQGAYVGFSLVNGIGPLRFKLLLDYFGTAEKAWNAQGQVLIELGIARKIVDHFVKFRSSFSLKSYLEEVARKEIKIITRISHDYPKQLLEIADPPIVLYLKGKLPVNWHQTIAVVGTRKPTTYGKQITQSLTRDLAFFNFNIVSGLARGIDAIAHRTALEYGAITIAVLGCGVDIVYPPEHKNLYSEIITNGGAIISEVPPGHTVSKGLFPARNRIISGLSKGVVVTEGAKDSGSLITAKLALDQGKEVFAVPGPITSYLSEGPTKLIKEGAKIVANVEDILEELNISPSISLQHGSGQELRKRYHPDGESGSKRINSTISGYTIPMSNLKVDKDGEVIIKLLSHNGEMHYDDLVRESALSASQIGAILTQLELGGIIRSLGNGKYTLN